jgi:hypothetical protein
VSGAVAASPDDDRDDGRRTDQVEHRRRVQRPSEVGDGDGADDSGVEQPGLAQCLDHVT